MMGGVETGSLTEFFGEFRTGLELPLGGGGGDPTSIKLFEKGFSNIL